MGRRTDEMLPCQSSLVQTLRRGGAMPNQITPFLWFDTQAEEAAAYYCSIFKNSRIVSVSRYAEAGPGETGSVMTVDFELGGQRFIGLNGGPEFRFTEAISFQVDCADQAEVDYY